MMFSEEKENAILGKLALPVNLYKGSHKLLKYLQWEVYSMHTQISLISFQFNDVVLQSPEAQTKGDRLYVLSESIVVLKFRFLDLKNLCFDISMTFLVLLQAETSGAFREVLAILNFCDSWDTGPIS